MALSGSFSYQSRVFVFSRVFCGRFLCLTFHMNQPPPEMAVRMPTPSSARSGHDKQTTNPRRISPSILLLFLKKSPLPLTCLYSFNLKWILFDWQWGERTIDPWHWLGGKSPPVSPRFTAAMASSSRLPRTTWHSQDIRFIPLNQNDTFPATLNQVILMMIIMRIGKSGLVEWNMKMHGWDSNTSMMPSWIKPHGFFYKIYKTCIMEFCTSMIDQRQNDATK